jgi:cell division protein FtsB
MEGLCVFPRAVEHLQLLRASGMISTVMAEGTSSSGKNARIWLLIAAVLGIIVLGDLNRRMTDARRLEQDAQLLQTEVGWLEAENSRLETQIANATSEAFIEAWAHSEGKMVRNGERLIIPIPAEGFVPTPTPFTQTSEPVVNKWEVWWALIFGDRP